MFHSARDMLDVCKEICSLTEEFAAEYEELSRECIELPGKFFRKLFSESLYLKSLFLGSLISESLFSESLFSESLFLESLSLGSLISESPGRGRSNEIVRLVNRVIVWRRS